MNRPKIVPDRRRYRRVPVSVFGRFMRDDKQEYPCQVINMSAGGMALLSPVACDDRRAHCRLSRQFRPHRGRRGARVRGRLCRPHPGEPV